MSEKLTTFRSFFRVRWATFRARRARRRFERVLRNMQHAKRRFERALRYRSPMAFAEYEKARLAATNRPHLERIDFSDPKERELERVLDEVRQAGRMQAAWRDADKGAPQ